MRVYHTTTAEAATAILRDGFNGVTAFFGRYALAGMPSPSPGSGLLTSRWGVGRAPPATLARAIRCWSSS
ncbi:MAG TPA: hypothetical protein VGS80_11835 [Ktedonobacterales bacterium]|nr:hypothetical protein [Ktedonobacterales bacterium]